MAIFIFLDIVKAAAAAQVWTLCVAGYAKDTIVGTYHRTSDEQVNKIIWRAELERDTIFFTSVSQRAESKAANVTISLGIASRWQRTSCSSSFISKVLGANWKRANNFHPVADKFAMCTDRK